MDLRKSDTATTENSAGGSSQDYASGSDKSSDSFFTKTPKKVLRAIQSVFTPKSGKLEDEFQKPGRPSPPKNKDGTVVDMEIVDVEKRMNKLGCIAATLSTENYGKLSWIIGKGLDTIILQKKGGFMGRWTVAQILLPSTPMGQRFDTIYKSDGDDTSDSKGLVRPLEFMREKLGVDTSSESTYTIYSDPDHDNVEYFSREQTWGNCHMQGPILLHWILSLWHDKDKKAGDVRMIHMSKYLRNAIPTVQLYDYIVEESGDSSYGKATMIMPEAFSTYAVHFHGSLTFEQIVDELKKRGPALVEMFDLYEDFQEVGKVEYAGAPPTGSKKLSSGHGMLLIGVSSIDTNIHPEYLNSKSEQQFKPQDNLGTQLTQVYLLLQNWWPGKPFLKVRLDYFLRCGGHLIFSNGCKVKEVTSDSYSTKTNSVRRAVTTAMMEKGNVRRTVKGLDRYS